MDDQTNLQNEPAYEPIEKFGQYWLVRARASGRYYGAGTMQMRVRPGVRR